MIKTSLRYFLSVAEHGSIRAASEMMNVAQSAISRQMQALEHEVGASLLTRNSKGVRLTPDGELLLVTIREVLSDSARLAADLDALRRLRRGHVRVAAIESMLPNLLPRVLDAFLGDHPTITFDVDVAETPAVLSAIRDGRADVGIAFCPILTRDLRLLFRVREPLMAVMHPSHPLAGRTRISLREFLKGPLALTPPGSGMRTLLDLACRTAGLLPGPTFETNSLELLRGFARSGSGLTILLRCAIEADVESGALVARPFQEKMMAGTVDVAALRERALPPSSIAFVSVLRRLLASSP